MAWQAPERMDEYLKPMELCDCDDEMVKDKAHELIKGAETPKEAAIRIFHSVRDGILYGADVVDAKASDTLKRGAALCLSKAICRFASRCWDTGKISPRWRKKGCPQRSRSQRGVSESSRHTVDPLLV